MVKGTSRQVIVVKGTAADSFDQAIFLVRSKALSKGGISEAELLKQAQISCKSTPASSAGKNLFWAICGAAATGFFWLLTFIM